MRDSVHPRSLFADHVNTDVHHLCALSRRHEQGILRLANSYGEERLKAAAGRAMAIGAHSFRSVNSILAHRLDENPPKSIELGAPIEHDNIRGPGYYH